MVYSVGLAAKSIRLAARQAAPKKSTLQFGLLGLRHLSSKSGSNTLKSSKEDFARKAAVPLADVMPRDGSRKDLKMLPSQANHLHLIVNSISKMSRSEEKMLAFLLDRYGAAVLAPEEDEGEAIYSKLDSFFGSVVPHDAMNEHGIVEINPARPTSINTADSKKPHLPHTDDAYTDNPSMFCTLQCREAAPSGGGETVLISGVELLAALSNKELKKLMKPGMVSMGRRPAADASWMKVSSIPMFWVDEDSGWLQLRWRCNDGCVQDINGEVKPAYEQMDAIAKAEVHQLLVQLAPREVLIIDNRAIAHGRRSYEAGEPRIMWRKNYQGDSDFAANLKNGLCWTYSSMFDGMSSMFDGMDSISSIDEILIPDVEVS